MLSPWNCLDEALLESGTALCANGGCSPETTSARRFWDGLGLGGSHLEQQRLGRWPCAARPPDLLLLYQVAMPALPASLCECHETALGLYSPTPSRLKNGLCWLCNCSWRVLSG